MKGIRAPYWVWSRLALGWEPRFLLRVDGGINVTTGRRIATPGMVRALLGRGEVRGRIAGYPAKGNSMVRVGCATIKRETLRALIRRIRKASRATEAARGTTDK